MILTLVLLRRWAVKSFRRRTRSVGSLQFNLPPKHTFDVAPHLADAGASQEWLNTKETDDAMHSTTPIEETMTIRQLHQRLREMQNQLDALRGSQVVDAQERMISLADEVVSLRRHILSLEERQQSLSDEIFPPPHYWHRYDTSSAW